MWQAMTAFLAHLVSGDNPLWLYYPLCLVVAIVYKATKFDEPKAIVRAALHFFVSVTLGMLVLAVVFYLVARFL
jgi:hypothetical protein